MNATDTTRPGPCMDDPMANDASHEQRVGRCRGCLTANCKSRRDFTTFCTPAPVVPTPRALDVQVAGDHYKGMVIQPVEFITRNGLGFLPGCVIKRVCRYKSKAGAQDLRKAIHELQLMLELEYPEENK